jgi:hypothetical protein
MRARRTVVSGAVPAAVRVGAGAAVADPAITPPGCCIDAFGSNLVGFLSDQAAKDHDASGRTAAPRAPRTSPLTGSSPFRTAPR